MAEKRIVNDVTATGLRNINNLILVGIMMAVGVVLRLCAGFLALGNMHPNFLIATYCLSILMIRPNFKEAAINGFISCGVMLVLGMVLLRIWLQRAKAHPWAPPRAQAAPSKGRSKPGAKGRTPSGPSRDKRANHRPGMGTKRGGGRQVT